MEPAGEPWEIDRLALYLASEDADYHGPEFHDRWRARDELGSGRLNPGLKTRGALANTPRRCASGTTDPHAGLSLSAIDIARDRAEPISPNRKPLDSVGHCRKWLAR